MNNSQGIITIDFMISLVVASIFCMILFALTFTFTVVEVSQYIAFATSRAHLAADLEPTLQEEAAKKKFDSLAVKNQVFAPLFLNDWFELKLSDIRQGEGLGSTFTEYPETESAAQTGVQLSFNAKLLSLNFSLLGSTEREGNGFIAKINGILIREPTTKECKDFFTTGNRFQGILDLDPRFNNLPIKPEEYTAMEDNGC